MTFKEAFAKARREKGPGKSFTWNGKSYTTNYAEEEKVAKSPRPKARPKGGDTVGASPRPKARPSSPRPKKRPETSSTRPKKRPEPLAPKTSPRPKDGTWPKVRNKVKESREEDKSSRQTVGENLRSIPDQIRQATQKLFIRSPNQHTATQDALHGKGIGWEQYKKATRGR